MKKSFAFILLSLSICIAIFIFTNCSSPDTNDDSDVIDPLHPTTFYAPSHYGRGMLKSTDGGGTWTLSQANLPSATAMKKVYALALHPTNSDMLFAATDDGLYRSLDSGVSFTKHAVTWGSVFRAVCFDGDGRLFMGSSDGTLKFSIDNGASWDDIFPGGGVGGG
jgi:hypothetical protein